jgi:peptidoglycan/LPS O-acetylase OafA/YrhL
MQGSSAQAGLTKRLPGLDVLRAIAAVAVLVSHALRVSFLSARQRLFSSLSTRETLMRRCTV